MHEKTDLYLYKYQDAFTRDGRQKNKITNTQFTQFCFSSFTEHHHGCNRVRCYFSYQDRRRAAPFCGVVIRLRPSPQRAPLVYCVSKCLAQPGLI